MAEENKSGGLEQKPKTLDKPNKQINPTAQESSPEPSLTAPQTPASSPPPSSAAAKSPLPQMPSVSEPSSSSQSSPLQPSSPSQSSAVQPRSPLSDSSPASPSSSTSPQSPILEPSPSPRPTSASDSTPPPATASSLTTAASESTPKQKPTPVKPTAPATPKPTSGQRPVQPNPTAPTSIPKTLSAQTDATAKPKINPASPPPDTKPDKKNNSSLGLRPKDEKHREEKEIKTPNQVAKKQKPIPARPPKPRPQPTQQLWTYFLNKLKQFRIQANRKRSQKAEENLKKIMAYARKKQKITNNEVEKLTGVKDAQATNYLKKLVKSGDLIKFGKTKNTFYKPVKK